jgi:hypothetical protein
MAESNENKHVRDELDNEVEPQPLPGEPQAPTEPTPPGDPSKVKPANGGWGSQDVPVPAN